MFAGKVGAYLIEALEMNSTIWVCPQICPWQAFPAKSLFAGKAGTYLIEAPEMNATIG
jgi:hypothetical protein